MIKYIESKNRKQNKLIDFDEIEVETSKEYIQIDLETLEMKYITIYNVEVCKMMFEESDITNIYKCKTKYYIEEWN